jgi:glucosamine--fructose-6-phosphate aminotransferase (isomerizing)
MCGIFAYLNFNVKKERRYILQVLFNGLRRLEYRGYDSAGIAIDSDNNSSSSSENSVASSPPLVFRREGNIESLVKSVYHGNFPLLDLSLSLSDFLDGFV